MTEKKKENSFLKAETVLAFNVFNEIIDAVSAVDKLAGDSFNLALVYNIAVYVTDICNSGNYACTVSFSETSFNVEFFVEALIEGRILLKISA